MKNMFRSVIVAVAVAAAVCAGSLSPAAARSIAVGVSTDSGVTALKNSDCGWGIKTKYHSCALGYSLVFQWLAVGKEHRGSLHQVYSPNSGNVYDFKCTGVKNVTCKSSKGSVTFKRAKLPAIRDCDEAGHYSVDAWLNTSCEFAWATAVAYEAKARDDYSPTRVKDPYSGLTYSMECFEVADVLDASMCSNSKRVVILYSE